MGDFDIFYMGRKNKGTSGSPNIEGNPYLTDDSKIIDYNQAKLWRKDYGNVVKKQQSNKFMYDGFAYKGQYEGNALYSLFRKHNITPNRLYAAQVNGIDNSDLPDEVKLKLKNKIYKDGDKSKWSEDVVDATNLRMKYDIPAWQTKKAYGITNNKEENSNFAVDRYLTNNKDYQNAKSYLNSPENKRANIEQELKNLKKFNREDTPWYVIGKGPRSGYDTEENRKKARQLEDQLQSFILSDQPKSNHVSRIKQILYNSLNYDDKEQKFKFAPKEVLDQNLAELNNAFTESMIKLLGKRAGTDVAEHIKQKTIPEARAINQMVNPLSTAEHLIESFAPIVSGNTYDQLVHNLGSMLGMKEGWIGDEAKEVMDTYIESIAQINKARSMTKHGIIKPDDIANAMPIAIMESMNEYAWDGILSYINGPAKGDNSYHNLFGGHRRWDDLDEQDVMESMLDPNNDYEYKVMQEWQRDGGRIVQRAARKELPQLMFDILTFFKAGGKTAQIGNAVPRFMTISKAATLAMKDPILLNNAYKSKGFVNGLRKSLAIVNPSTWGKGVVFNSRYIPSTMEVYGHPLRNTLGMGLGAMMSYLYHDDPTKTPEEMVERGRDMMLLGAGGEILAHTFGNVVRMSKPIINWIYKTAKTKPAADAMMRKWLMIANTAGQFAGGTAAAALWQQGAPMWSKDFILERGMVDLAFNTLFLTHQGINNARHAARINKFSKSESLRMDPETKTYYLTDEQLSNIYGEDLSGLTPEQKSELAIHNSDTRVESIRQPDLNSADAGERKAAKQKLNKVEVREEYKRGDYIKNLVKEEGNRFKLGKLSQSILDKEDPGSPKLDPLQKKILEAAKDSETDIEIVEQYEFEEALRNKDENTILMDHDGIEYASLYYPNENKIVIPNKESSNQDVAFFTAQAILHEGDHSIIVPKYRNNPDFKARVDKFKQSVVNKFTDAEGEYSADILLRRQDPAFRRSMDYALDPDKPEELLAALHEFNNPFGSYLKKNIIDVNLEGTLWSLIRNAFKNRGEKLNVYREIYKGLEKYNGPALKDKTNYSNNIYGLPEYSLKQDSFKRWFGDWENNPDDITTSYITRGNILGDYYKIPQGDFPEEVLAQMRREKSMPIQVYHGTQEPELGTENNPLRVKRGNRKAGDNLAGIYVTTDPEYASGYAETDRNFINRNRNKAPQVYPLYANIKNPIIVGEEVNVEGYGTVHLPYAYDRYNNPVPDYNVYNAEMKNLKPEFPSYFTQDHLDYYLKLGYDGIVWNNGKEIIAFRPDQIKSVFNDKPGETPYILGMPESFNREVKNEEAWQEYDKELLARQKDLLTIMSKIQNDEDKEIMNTIDANSERVNDNFINNGYAAAGYRSASHFFRENIGKPTEEVYNNIREKIRKSNPKLDQKVIDKEARHIAIRLSNIDEIIPVRYSEMIDENKAIQTSVSIIKSRTNRNGVVINKYQGKQTYFEAWKRKMFNQMPQDMDSNTREIILQLFESKPYVVKEATLYDIADNSLPETNKHLRADYLIKKGFYPIKTNVFLYSSALENLSKGPDIVKADFTRRMHEFSLKKWLKTETAWYGRKPDGMDDLVEQLDYNKIIEFISDKNNGNNLFKDNKLIKDNDLYNEIKHKITDYYTNDNGRIEVPKEINISAALDDLFAWKTDPGGQTRRYKYRDADHIEDNKYHTKYNNLSLADATIALKGLDEFNMFVKIKDDKGNIDPIAIHDLGKRGMRYNNKDIVKRVARLDDWVWQDEAGNVNEWLRQFVNDKANDGGEYTINNGYHAFETEVMGGDFWNTATVKAHGANDGVLEKTASHYEPIDEYTKEHHPEIYNLIKNNRNDIAQIAQGSSFKAKAYEYTVRKKAATEEFGYIIQSPEGEWLYAIDGTGKENPDMFLREKQYVRDQLAKGIIPESMILEIPVTGEYGQKYLYKSHTAKLGKIPLSVDAAPGFYRDSFFFKGNNEALDAILKMIDKNQELYINQVEDLFILRDLATKAFYQKAFGEPNRYTIKTLVRAGNGINMLKEMIEREYAKTSDVDNKRSFVVNYNSKEAVGILDSCLDRNGVLKPEKIPTMLYALDRVITGWWQVHKNNSPIAGFDTLLGYRAKELINDAILARVPGVNLVVQPHGADIQHMYRGIDMYIDNYRNKISKIYTDQKVIDEKVEKYETAIRAKAEQIKAENYNEIGELKDGTTGILVSIDALEELNKYQEATGGKKIGLFSKAMVNLTPSAGLDSTQPVTIVGILPTSGAIRMNKFMAADILGRDNDFDKIQLFIPPDEMWNHWVKKGMHKGYLNELHGELDMAEKTINRGQRFINEAYKLPYKEFVSKPQFDMHGWYARAADQYIGDGVGAKKVVAYALQYLQQSEGLKERADGKAVSTSVSGVKFGKEEAQIINKLSNLAVDKYNPNHVDVVEGIVQIIKENSDRDGKEFKKFIYEMAKMGNTRSTEGIRDADNWTAVDKELSAFYRIMKEIGKDSPTPMKAMKKLSNINFSEHVKDLPEKGRYNILADNGAELYSLMLHNRLSKAIIERTTETIKDKVDISIYPKGTTARTIVEQLKSGIVQAKTISKIGLLLARNINKAQPDNIYDVTREQPLFRTFRYEGGEKVYDDYSKETYDRIAYLSTLETLRERYEYRPEEIILSEHDTHSIRLEDGEVYYRNKKGKEISQIIDEQTMEPRDVSRVKLDDLIDDTGNLSVEYSKVKDWLANPALQEGFIYDKELTSKWKDKLKAKIVARQAKYIAKMINSNPNEIATLIGFSQVNTKKALEWMYQNVGFADGSILLTKQLWSENAAKKEALRMTGSLDEYNKDPDNYKDRYLTRKQLLAGGEKLGRKLFVDTYKGDLMYILAELKKEGIEPTLNSVELKYRMLTALDAIGKEEMVTKPKFQDDYIYGMPEENVVRPEFKKISDIIGKGKYWRMPYIVKSQALRTSEEIYKLISEGKVGLESWEGKDLSTIFTEHEQEVYDYILKPIILQSLGDNVKHMSNERLMDIAQEMLTMYDPQTQAKAERFFSSIGGGEIAVKAAKVTMLVDMVRQLHRLGAAEHFNGNFRTFALAHPFKSQHTLEILQDQSTEQKAYPVDYVLGTSYAISNGEITGEANSYAGAIADRAMGTGTEHPLLPVGYVDYIRPLDNIRGQFDQSIQEFKSRLKSGEFGEFGKSMSKIKKIRNAETKEAWQLMHMFEDFEALDNLQINYAQDIYGKKTSMQAVYNNKIHDIDNLQQVVDDLYIELLNSYINKPVAIDPEFGMDLEEGLTLDYLEKNKQKIKDALNYVIKLKSAATEMGNRIIAASRSIEFHNTKLDIKRGIRTGETIPYEHTTSAMAEDYGKLLISSNTKDLLRLTRRNIMPYSEQLQALTEILTTGEARKAEYENTKLDIKALEERLLGNINSKFGMEFKRLWHITPRDALVTAADAEAGLADLDNIDPFANTAKPNTKHSLWFWQNVMENAVKTNTDGAYVPDSVKETVIQGLADDITEQMLSGNRHVYSQRLEKIKAESGKNEVNDMLLAKQEYESKPFEFELEGRKLAEEAYKILERKVEVSNGTNSFWYDLAKRAGVKQLDREWHELSGGERAEYKRRMESITRQTIESFIDNINANKEVMDADYYFNRTNLDIGSIKKDGMFKLTLEDSAKKYKDIYADDLILAYMRMMNLPVEGKMSYNPYKLLEHARTKHQNIMGEVETETSTEYIANTKEDNQFAHNTVISKIGKTRYNNIFYGYGTENKVDINQLREKVLTEGRTTFARQGTPVRFRYIDEKGKVRYGYGDLLGVTTRNMQVPARLMPIEMPGKPPSSDWPRVTENKVIKKNAVIAVYNPVEHKMTVTNLDHITDMHVGYIHDTHTSRVINKQKHETYSMFGDKLLSYVENADFEHNPRFSHSSNWIIAETTDVGTKESQDRWFEQGQLPGKNGFGVWTYNARKDNLGNYDEIQHTLSAIEANLKNKNWYANALLKMQEASYKSRVVTEYLGYGNLMDAVVGGIAGADIMVARGVAGFLGKIFRLPVQNLAASRILEARQTLEYGLSAPWMAVKNIAVDAVKAFRKEYRDPRLKEATPLLQLESTMKAENEATMVDEMLDTAIRNIADPTPLNMEGMSFKNINRNKKALIDFFNSINRSLLSDEDKASTMQLINLLKQNLAEYRRQDADVKFITAPDGTRIPIVDGLAMRDYLNFNISLVDNLMYLLSGQGFAQNTEHASTRLAYEAAGDYLSQVQTVYNNANKILGLEKGDLDRVLMTEMQAVLADKIVGNYDKPYQYRSFTMKHMTMFQSFNKERQIDLTSYMKDRQSYIETARYMLMNDPEFLGILKDDAGPSRGIITGGGIVYNPAREIYNMSTGSLLYLAMKGLPWVMRAGFLQSLTGGLFYNAIGQIIDNTVGLMVVPFRAAYMLFSDGIRLFSYPGQTKIWSTLDKNGNEMVRKPNDVVADKVTGSTALPRFLGELFGLGPMEEKLIEGVGQYAMFALGEAFTRARTENKENWDKYDSQIKKAMMWNALSPITSMTGTRSIAKVDNEMAKRNKKESEQPILYYKP